LNGESEEGEPVLSRRKRV